MAVLSRNNLVHAQRIDVNDIRAIDSFAASDFRAIIKFICGDSPYIVDGCKISRVISNKLYVQVNNMFLFLPNDDSGSFYKENNNREDIEVDLPLNGRVYLELKIQCATGSPTVKGLWDSLAVTATSPYGSEYQSQVDSEVYLEIELVTNSSGFGSGIPIATIDMQSGELTNIQDNRNMFFKTEVGGPLPETSYRKPFSKNREQSPIAGSSVGDSSGSPFRDRDSFGVLNPAGFKSLKDYIDGIAIVLAEMQGSPVWYTTTGANQIVDDLNLKTMFSYSASGHSLEAQDDLIITWNRDSNGNRDYKLRTEGSGILTYSDNYSRLRWFVGGSYSSDRIYDSSIFETQVIPNNASLFLQLQHDVVLTGNNVEWAPAVSSNTINPTQVVKGIAGDFATVAVGDFIRKRTDSKTLYKVIGYIQDSVLHEPEEGTLIPLNVSEIKVDVDITNSTTEPFHFYRVRYSQEDLVSESDNLIEKYTGAFKSTNFYWLGRRKNNNFTLRDYGILSSGESTYTLNDSPVNAERDQSLEINILKGTRFQIVSGNPKIRFFDGSGYIDNHTVVQISKQIKNNWNATTASNNSAIVHYELKISASQPLMFTNNGDQLWVDLSEESGTHSLLDKTVITPANQSLIANYQNKNMHFLARRQDINGVPYLVFIDGKMLSINGLHEIAQKNFDAKVIHRSGRVVNLKETSISTNINFEDEIIIVNKINNLNVNITLPDTNNDECLVGTLFEIKDGNLSCNVDSPITIRCSNLDETIDNEENYIMLGEGEAIKIIYTGNKKWKII